MIVDARQLLFFYEKTEIHELKQDLDELKVSHGKVRRGMFKRLSTLTKELNAIKKQLEEE